MERDYADWESPSNPGLSSKVASVLSDMDTKSSKALSRAINRMPLELSNSVFSVAGLPGSEALLAACSFVNSSGPKPHFSIDLFLNDMLAREIATFLSGSREFKACVKESCEHLARTYELLEGSINTFNMWSDKKTLKETIAESIKARLKCQAEKYRSLVSALDGEDEASCKEERDASPKRENTVD